MARYTGPKCRLCRREGVKLFLKGDRCFSPKCPIDRKGAVPPGLHGVKARKKMSDFGYQLRAKQKAKRTYGVLEKQFRRYFDNAKKVKGATGEALLRLLETRLDNVVYRLGFAPNRVLARQMVSHKHITVNQKINYSPSTIVKIGDLIGFTLKGLNSKTNKAQLEKKEVTIPAWLERKAAVGKVLRLPEKDDIDTNINEQLIVEYYSR